MSGSPLKLHPSRPVLPHRWALEDSSTSLGPAARLLACSRWVCPVTEMCWALCTKKTRENARNQHWHGNIAMTLWCVLFLRAFLIFHWQHQRVVAYLFLSSIINTCSILFPTVELHSANFIRLSSLERSQTFLVSLCVCVCQSMSKRIHGGFCICFAASGAVMSRKLISNHAHSRPFPSACQQGWAFSCH